VNLVRKKLSVIGLGILAFITFSASAYSQTGRITEGTNYGLHFIPERHSIRIAMTANRDVMGDPPSEFSIIVNWYAAAPDGSILPQRIRQTVDRYTLRANEATSWRFVQRARAGEWASIQVHVTVDPPDPDADPPTEFPQFPASASVFLTQDEKSLIGLLLPAVQIVRKAGDD